MAVARFDGTSGPDQAAVYPSPSARLAAFIAALGRGTAWDGWLFADRGGLKALPPGAAIRTLAEADPALSLAAWCNLPSADRVIAARTLQPIDAIRTLAALCSASPGEASHAALAALLQNQPEDGLTGAAGRLLRIFAVFDPGEGLPFASLAAADALIEQLGELSEDSLEALRSGATGAFVAAAITLDPAQRALLAALPEPERRKLAERVSQPDDHALPAWSAHAGLLMLVPWIGLPDGLNPDGAAQLLHLVLASVAGPQRSDAVLADEALLRALPVDPRCDRAALAQRLAEALALHGPDPDPWFELPGIWRDWPGASSLGGLARAALTGYCARLVGFDGSSPAFLVENLLGGGGIIDCGPDFVRATLDRPRLDVLLSISGLASRTSELPDGRLLVLERGP